MQEEQKKVKKDLLGWGIVFLIIPIVALGIMFLTKADVPTLIPALLIGFVFGIGISFIILSSSLK